MRWRRNVLHMVKRTTSEQETSETKPTNLGKTSLWLCRLHSKESVFRCVTWGPMSSLVALDVVDCCGWVVGRSKIQLENVALQLIVWGVASIMVSPQLIGGLPGPTWTLHVRSPNSLSQHGCGHNLTRLYYADTVGCFTHDFSGFSNFTRYIICSIRKLVPK